MLKKLVIVAAVCMTTQAFAGQCILHVKRVACEGKEKESYTKCKDLSPECDSEPVEATSEKDCAKKALKSCENARLDITKLKTITAKFDGKPVEGGKQFCAQDRPDFNKCK